MDKKISQREKYFTYISELCKYSEIYVKNSTSTIPDFHGTDIWADTLRKNAKIVSKTKAQREFKADCDFYTGIDY